MKHLIVITFLLLFFTPISAQTSTYLPPQREGISDRTYEKWVYSIKRYREQLKDNSLNKDIRIILEFNIASGYMMLDEPVDSVYGILYHAMRLDTAFVCYQIIDGNNSHKSFGIKNYESLSTSKWKKLYEFCKPYRQGLEEEYQILVEADEKKVNPNLLALLKMIMNRDGYYRDGLEETEQNYGSNSKIAQNLWKKQQHLDSLNCILVDSLIDAHNGYIGDEITGEYHKNDLLIIALHSTSVSFLDKHYAMFEQLVKRNIVSKDLFMILSDRYHLQKYGKQIFGTQRGYSYSDEPNVCRAAPMYPEEKLIELKKELGFKHH